MTTPDLKNALLDWLAEVAEVGAGPNRTSAGILAQLTTWSTVLVAIESVASPSRRPELYYFPENGSPSLRPVSLLEETGLSNVASAVAGGYYVDVDAVTDHLVGVLTEAPPTVDLWWLINADLPPGSTFSVADHQLETVDRDRLVGLSPIPPAYDFVPARHRIDADQFRNSTFLHRSDPTREPAQGFRFPFFTGRPELQLWRPMLSLALWSPEVVRVDACWAVECGRRVDVLYDNVVLDVGSSGPDPVDEYEFYRHGLYEVDEGTPIQSLGAFVAAVDGCIENVLRTGPKSGSKARSQRARRLRRSAEHILRASQRSFGSGAVLDEEERDEVLLHYVIAVEALLAQQETELSRRVSQRAAGMFADDAERVEVADVLQRSYGLRSKYVHGDDTGSFSLERLREIVLSIMLRWLVLQAQHVDADTVTNLLDESLLSESVRSTEIMTIIADFVKQYPCPLTSCPAAR